MTEAERTMARRTRLVRIVRTRALARLAEAHAEEYSALYHEEMQSLRAMMGLVEDESSPAPPLDSATATS